MSKISRFFKKIPEESLRNPSHVLPRDRPLREILAKKCGKNLCLCRRSGSVHCRTYHYQAARGRRWQTRCRVDRVRGARMRVRVTRFAQTSWSRLYQASMGAVEAAADERARVRLHTYISRATYIYPTQRVRVRHARVRTPRIYIRVIACRPWRLLAPRNCNAMRFPRVALVIDKRGATFLNRKRVSFTSLASRYYKHEFSFF